MKRTSNLTIVFAIACFAVASQALAQDKPLLQSTDRATGASVQIYRSANGPRLNVQSPSVTVEKFLAPGGVVVTNLRHGKESLRIEVTDRQMVVSGTRGRVVAPAGDQAAAERARELVAKSPLTKRATDLIGKMGFGDGTPVQPLLLTTRAFLLAASKDGSGFAELKRWMQNKRSSVSVVKVSLPVGQQKSSSQCYKEYGDELLAAFDDFIDCINHIKWWDPFWPKERCELVYEVRILAAFAGWMACLGVLAN